MERHFRDVAQFGQSARFGVEKFAGSNPVIPTIWVEWVTVITQWIIGSIPIAGFAR